MVEFLVTSRLTFKAENLLTNLCARLMSPWWGGLDERLMKDMKKTFYKTMGRTSLKYDQAESVVMDIERHLNNRPLTYVESDFGEEEVLTLNIIMWCQNAHIVEDRELDGDEVTRLQAQHVWQRWKREYLNSLLESHRIKRGKTNYPEVGEVVLIIGDEKNRGEWKKCVVLKHIRGKDGIVRGLALRHKGHIIERSRDLQLLMLRQRRRHKSCNTVPDAQHRTLE